MSSNRSRLFHSDLAQSPRHKAPLPEKLQQSKYNSMDISSGSLAALGGTAIPRMPSTGFGVSGLGRAVVPRIRCQRGEDRTVKKL
jgi:hypothetical protein